MGDNKKVHQIELVPSEQVLAVVSGRNRHVRLIAASALDGRDGEAYKLAETKGCQTLCWGVVRQGGTLSCLCVAVKRQVIIYELTKTRTRQRRLRELQAPAPVQWMAIMSDRLYVGYQVQERQGYSYS